MTEQTANILNRLLAKAVIVLLIASALVLAPIILAGLELLGKGQTMTDTKCARCGETVIFGNVSAGYFCYCPAHDEDLFEFETERATK